jgi:hypothetical protein
MPRPRCPFTKLTRDKNVGDVDLSVVDKMGLQMKGNLIPPTLEGIVHRKSSWTQPFGQGGVFGMWLASNVFDMRLMLLGG